MRVNELMVGNYVDYCGNAFKVTDLSSPWPRVDDRYNNKSVVTIFNGGIFTVDTEEVQPIHITEEFLIQNGFVAETIHADECVVNYYKLRLDNCKIVISDVSNIFGRDWTIHVDDAFRCSIASACVHYVHQMQNMLNILDIEWEVKI